MQLDLTTMEQLLDAIAAGQTILCVSHVGPDGDAVGSLLGMYWMLDHLDKTPTAALADPVPDNLTHVPGADRIVGPDAVADDYDLIICLDASSPDRMGAVFRPEVHGDIPLLVIDHHVTNTNFGRVNWVEPGCAATCQMLVYLAQADGIPLRGPLAQCLLTGIVTDTLGFRTSNTDTDVLDAAMQLMRGGANLADITAQTLNRRRFSMVQLMGQVLPAVHLDDHVIWLAVSQAQMAAAGHDPQEDLGLSSFLISTVEADISATFVEKRDEAGNPMVECSFRAKPGFNVSDLAFSLGGGGHPPASGCTVPGTLDQVTAKVVPMLKAARQEQAAARAEA